MPEGDRTGQANRERQEEVSSLRTRQPDSALYASTYAIPVDQAAADPVKALEKQIEVHRRFEGSKSYLGKATSLLVDVVTNRDQRSLERMQDALKRIKKDGINSVGVAEVDRLITTDSSRLRWHNEAHTYTGGLAKTSLLFLRGNHLLTAGVFAADQAKPEESLGMQLLDGSLGAGKGLLTKTVFGLTHNIDSVVNKGLTLGIANRAIDLALTRETYQSGTGESSLATGLRNIAEGTVNKHALMTDVVLFGGAHGLFRGINGATGGAIAKSPFLSTVFTGGTFGLISGTTEEIYRQRDLGVPIQWEQVLMRGALKAGFDSIAAIPAGRQGARLFRPAEQIPAAPENLMPQLQQRTVESTRPVQVATSSENLKPIGTITRTYKAGIFTEKPFSDLDDFLNKGRQLVEPELNVFETGLPAEVLIQANRPDYSRPGAEAVVDSIKRLPDPTLITELAVVDHEHANAPWVRQMTGDTIAGETNYRGEVTLFRPTEAGLNQTVAHEWGHIFKMRHPDHAAVFEAASKVEAFQQTLGRSVAYNQTEEPWGIISENLLAQPAEKALVAALYNPVRAAVFLKAVELHVVLSPTEPSVEATQVLKGLNSLKPILHALVRERLRSHPLSAEAEQIMSFLKED